ncbi:MULTISPECIES: NAD-dependent epimerase/dehydratase family protein [Streptomyces]|uniref:NAD-dependent epimerase/dehydratase family protein n=1 Tax=Streptomyces TaxID=1883 RepID=UPI0029AA57BC|nr:MULTISPECIES: NAD(P)-dependent oxidoreductase [Streptomyces]MDX3088153.1 NAD(P)-dependent oxidoreductase [Streptomyces sp. ME12-02E]MDX3331509.1 NAD(P)-dependent oxidoreductase [Streptomyces sp. ME02-6978a]
MILVTGGLGFIGSHTVRALLDLGEECLLVQRNARPLPSFLDGKGMTLEQADVTDLDSLLALGRRHTVTGIVHLAGSYPWPPMPEGAVAATRRSLDGLLNMVQAAEEWGVRRLGLASTIGVYGGIDHGRPLREDAPLTMTAPVSIPTFKKVGELLSGFLDEHSAVELVNYRISGTWGPLGHADPFFAAPALVHAAARGTEPDLSGLIGPAFAGDGLDLNYVKDTGRALALLQLADRLNHRTYNVGAGRATTNAEVAEALKKAVPDARIDLPAGGGGPHMVFDIDRLRQDTGYRPEYDTERAAADYVAWLRAGNAR